MLTGKVNYYKVIKQSDFSSDFLTVNMFFSSKLLRNVNARAMEETWLGGEGPHHSKKILT